MRSFSLFPPSIVKQQIRWFQHNSLQRDKDGRYLRLTLNNTRMKPSAIVVVVVVVVVFLLLPLPVKRCATVTIYKAPFSSYTQIYTQEKNTDLVWTEGQSCLYQFDQFDQFYQFDQFDQCSGLVWTWSQINTQNELNVWRRLSEIKIYLKMWNILDITDINNKVSVLIWLIETDW